MKDKFNFYVLVHVFDFVPDLPTLIKTKRTSRLKRAWIDDNTEFSNVSCLTSTTALQKTNVLISLPRSNDEGHTKATSELLA